MAILVCFTVSESVGVRLTISEAYDVWVSQQFLRRREYSCPNCDDDNGEDEDRDDHNDGDGDVFVSCFYFCFCGYRKFPSTTCNIISQ